MSYSHYLMVIEMFSRSVKKHHIICKDYHNLKTKAINEFALLEPDVKQYKGEYYGLNRANGKAYATLRT